MRLSFTLCSLLPLVIAVGCGGDFVVDYIDPVEEPVAREPGFPLATPEEPAPAPAPPGEPPPTPEPRPEPVVPEPPAEPEIVECTETSTGFDIEEVSTLQDAFGLPGIRDGLSLSVHPDQLADGWRPVAVEVLVMYPAWYFEFYTGTNTLSVHVYGASTPSGQPYSLELPITTAGLDWQPLTLPHGADWSADDREQVAAWLRFDLSDVIPPGAFVDPEYFVAVGWDSMGFPNVGYSNFELDCAANWTDHGSGMWKQNSGQDCSWPMLSIELESVTEGDCE